MNKFRINKISKADFLNLNEDNLMFITNPGRMGDEDGSTFIIKGDSEFIIYRVSGWMYPDNNEKEDIISLDDMIKQFPLWYKAWKHSNEGYKGKYKYIYMGFGNGLCVDNTIYDEFLPYLNHLADKYLEDSSEEERDNLKYAAIYNAWMDALIEMAKDKRIVISR